MSAVVDFHSHVLPGIDDGSASVEESIEMLQMEAKQGIRHVIATPHFYANYDSPDRFIKRRTIAERKLREEMSRHVGLPEISVGAEVYYFSGISESDIILELTIAQNGCILIEMPHSPWTESMYRELEGIYSKRGILPIIAHIDRYIDSFHTYGIPERLAELPVLVQANADFFLRFSTKKMALKMLKAGHIQLLGSDCHNLKDRAPNLGEAVEWIRKKAGSEMIAHIEASQNTVLQNLSIV